MATDTRTPWVTVLKARPTGRRTSPSPCESPYGRKVPFPASHPKTSHTQELCPPLLQQQDTLSSNYNDTAVGKAERLGSNHQAIYVLINVPRPWCGFLNGLVKSLERLKILPQVESGLRVLRFPTHKHRCIASLSTSPSNSLSLSRSLLRQIHWCSTVTHSLLSIMI